MNAHNMRLKSRTPKRYPTIISIMPPGMALKVTLRGSNYRCLEQMFMIPKGFEPSKFDCNSNWDTDPNKSYDFLLAPFRIYNKYAMFWFVFSVKNYTNKILFKLTLTCLKKERKKNGVVHFHRTLGCRRRIKQCVFSFMETYVDDLMFYALFSII